MRSPARVRELARDTAIEASRQYMAELLWWERAGKPYDSEHRMLDALQTLRDSLAAERAVRS